MLQPVEEREPKAAENPDLREVHMNIDQARKNELAAHVVQHSAWPGCRDLRIIAAAKDAAIFNRQSAILQRNQSLWLVEGIDRRVKIEARKIPIKRSFITGAPGEIRTPDLLVRSQTLYPTELRAHTVSGTHEFNISIRYPDRVKPPVENEIKLPVESAAKGRALLRRHGFQVIAPRIFEQNLVLDDGRGSLRTGGMLLRVRRAGKKVTCTFKGPDKPGRHKRRVENEFTASDFAACLDVFGGIGFREAFRYEKYRTEFVRDNENGVATLDETPIGVYLELEGPARWIDRTAKAMGFAQDAYVTASYSQLYNDWCEARRVKPTDMRF